LSWIGIGLKRIGISKVEVDMEMNEKDREEFSLV